MAVQYQARARRDREHRQERTHLSPRQALFAGSKHSVVSVLYAFRKHPAYCCRDGDIQVLDLENRNTCGGNEHNTAAVTEK